MKAIELKTNKTAKTIVAMKMTFSAPRRVDCTPPLEVIVPAENPDVLF